VKGGENEKTYPSEKETGKLKRRSTEEATVRREGQSTPQASEKSKNHRRGGKIARTVPKKANVAGKPKKTMFDQGGGEQ